jgi:hypothetical protein
MAENGNGNGNGGYQNGSRPFRTVTLGNLLAAIPAFGLCIGLIIWATTQGNVNAEQGRAIDFIQQSYYSKNDAAAGRALRDAQIAALQGSITGVQSGINATLTILSNRMDRAFQRLDDLQTTVVELKTTVGFLQNRQANNSRRLDTSPDASQVVPR